VLPDGLLDSRIGAQMGSQHGFEDTVAFRLSVLAVVRHYLVEERLKGRHEFLRALVHALEVN
jgi:hypothetical protein